MHRVIDAILLFLHLDLSRAADADHRDAADELGEALLKLFAVIIGGRLLDLRLDLGDARLDIGLLAGTVDDGGVLLFDAHTLCPAEHLQRYVLELDAEVLGNHVTGSEHRDVLQHGLAAVTEAWCLHGGDLETTAQLVDDQRSLEPRLRCPPRDDEERLAGLYHRFEDRGASPAANSFFSWMRI